MVTASYQGSKATVHVWPPLKSQDLSEVFLLAVPTKVSKRMFSGTKVPTGAGVSFFLSYFFLEKERKYNAALLFVHNYCLLNVLLLAF